MVRVCLPSSHCARTKRWSHCALKCAAHSHKNVGEDQRRRFEESYLLGSPPRGYVWLVQIIGFGLTVLDLGREAVYKANVFPNFGEVMASNSAATIEKACLLLTSLAHHRMFSGFSC